MHYALAPWFDKVFKTTCRGECGLVIYADDFVATFQYKDEAERFLETVRNRFKEFGLELEPEKTRLIEFGRFAQESEGVFHHLPIRTMSERDCPPQAPG